MAIRKRRPGTISLSRRRVRVYDNLKAGMPAARHGSPLWTVRLISLAAFFALVFTAGCASVAHRQKLASFDEVYITGSYAAAAELELEQGWYGIHGAYSLLSSLQAATALRYSKQYGKSTEVFDASERAIKKYNEQLMLNEAGSTITSLLVNDSARAYRGEEYDGIMVNTYKALNFWSIGKPDLARVEFNRALDRQRRAKEHFSKEIANLKRTIDDRQSELDGRQAEVDSSSSGSYTPRPDISKAVENPEIDRIMRERYSNIYEFSPYPDFVNPFTTYMTGLFFMSQGDYKKASTLLKETYGMVDGNTALADDFRDVEDALEGVKKRNSDDHYVWVIFENGLGPIKEEVRLDVPVFLFTNMVKYMGIALPVLRFREEAHPYLIVEHENEMSRRTEPLASMENVIMAEFRKDLPATVTRAVASLIIKTYGQYYMQRQYGDLGGVLSGIYSLVTTTADLRIWSALPKEFQVARVRSPEDGLLTIGTPEGRSVEVQVRPGKNSVVYVKIPMKRAKIYYEVIEM